MFLGVQPTISNWNGTFDEFSLILDPNPLTEFVELPEDGRYDGLCYSQLLCGAIRGALEMVQLKVECSIKAEQLKSIDTTTGSTTEIQVKFIEVLQDAVPIGED